MIDHFVNNPKSPKYYVKRFLDNNINTYKGKTVLDIPAGNGATSEILLENGANVEAFDLFPEYFMLKNIECKRADILNKIPTPDNHAHLIICQEGIEHFSDQLKAFNEFNRVLELKGELLITTPSYSNLASKMSYQIFESENSKLMPPNEIDDIWMNEKDLISTEIYHGHIFLVGLQRLRVLAKLSGFKIKEIQYVRLSKWSLFLLPFFYPIIYISSHLRYFKFLKKHKNISLEDKKSIYKEQLEININIKNLINKHTFIIFEKEKNINEINFKFESNVKPFDKIM